MKLGWPVLLAFVASVWKQLQVWIRTSVAIAGIIADALHESDIGTLFMWNDDSKSVTHCSIAYLHSQSLAYNSHKRSLIIFLVI